MFSHYTKMAVKALLRFKLHSAISMLSLLFGFICFIAAVLISNYTQSFDQHFPNSGKIHNIIMRTTGDLAAFDKFPIVNEPAAKYLRTYFPEIPNIARATPGQPRSITIDGEAMNLDVRFVEERFFDIFPLETISGIETGSSLPPNTVLITEDAALKVFGTTDVVGRRMMIDNRDDVSIAGVSKRSTAPTHLESPIVLFNTEVFIPMELADAVQREAISASGGDPDADRWGNQSGYVYMEFPEDFDLDVEEFNDRLDEFVTASIPADRAEFMSYEIQPINQLVASQIAFVTGGFDITQILIVAGALVLLIGCLNYSNLVIAQLSLRSQEIGVQKILGAKRSMLVVQYCYESLLFVLSAIFLALGVFFFVLLQLQSSGVVGVGPAMLLNPSLWGSLTIVIVLIVAVAGGYPAVRTAMVSLVSMMRPKGSGGYSGRLRAVMVGMQFFISGTLMILAFIMFAQNVAMTQQLDGTIADPKIVIETRIDTLDIDPELLTAQLTRSPAVLSVTQVDRPPWELGMGTSSYSREGDLNATRFELITHNVGHDYNQTMDMPVLAGRAFTKERTNDLLPSNDQLTLGGGPYAIIIDDKTAQSFGWENAEAALGQFIYRHMEPPSVEREMSVQFEIVGSVGAQKFQLIDWTQLGPGGHVYLLKPEVANIMIVKISKNEINEALQHIDQVWSSLMPETPLKRTFADDLFYQMYNLFLSISGAIGALSLFGFFIASIGLLGNATFITNIRQKEVGIRKVMGASSGRLLRMLLLDFAKPILIANVFAWPLGYVIGNGYTSLFAAQTSITYLPFIVSFVLSILIAVSAVLSQSWKSARVRPAMVLRYE